MDFGSSLLFSVELLTQQTLSHVVQRFLMNRTGENAHALSLHYSVFKLRLLSILWV